MTVALVLAGGGVAGIAWETGFLLGVQDESPLAASRLLGADVLLGTSAGSTVAAQLSSGPPAITRMKISQPITELQLAPRFLLFSCIQRSRRSCRL